jgi:anthranilate phosphoribosyltransferase
VIAEAIGVLVAGSNLTRDQAAAAMDEIMNGEATPAQFGAFVTALRIKGETVDEIVGLASTMRAHALRVHLDGPAVDTCGTGGDHSGSFNVSTAAAIVAAAGGLTIAKHGNRGMTSASGSADVLEALGVNITLSPGGVEACLREAGIAFLFAQTFHPAMKYAAAPRREIGIRTVFNILGPLTNPAGAEYQVLGVAEEGLARILAEALLELGARHALVVHGTDGLDEVSLAAPTVVAEVRRGEPIHVYRIDPAHLELASAPRDAIRGGSPGENAARMRAIFDGETGPYRDVVVLNAAAALVAGDAVADLAAGVARAQDLIDSGAARDRLRLLIETSQRLA